jgi:hypothetical protein
MYQFGVVLKIILFAVPILLILFCGLTQWWYFLFWIPYFFLLSICDNIKRGVVFTKKIEWEKGPFDYESLPLAVRSFFNEGKPFLEAAGFQYQEEGLFTVGTSNFGRSETKSLVRFFLNPGTGEGATQSFAFSWNPANSRCILLGVRWRFMSFIQNKTHMTTNAQGFTNESRSDKFHIKRLDLLDPLELLNLHRAWAKTLPAPASAYPFVLTEYLHLAQMDELEQSVRNGFMFEDPALNGFRYTVKGVGWALTRYFKLGYHWQNSIQGLKSFVWKIRPKLNDEVLRSLVGEGEGVKPGGDERVAGFRIDFWGLFLNRLFNFGSGPWLTLTAVIIFVTHLGNLASSIHGTYVYWIAGMVVDFVLLLLFFSVVSLVLPFGGERWSALFGQRRFKFYGEVICYETPHGVTSCVLGNFPQAKRVGNWLWVKVPGVSSFVLRPSRFEGEGYQVFAEEMGKKNLVKSYQMPRILFWLFIASCLALAWGMGHFTYFMGEEYRNCQGVFNRNQAVLAVVKTTFAFRQTAVGEMWLPALIFQEFSESNARKDKLNGEIWRLGPQGLTQYPVTFAGDYFGNLIPLGPKVYATTQAFHAVYGHPMDETVYQIGETSAQPVTGEVVNEIEKKINGRNIVYTDGWQPLGCGGENVRKNCRQALPGGYEYFEDWELPGKNNKMMNTFGIRKDGRTLVTAVNDYGNYMKNNREMTKEEYDRF